MLLETRKGRKGRFSYHMVYNLVGRERFPTQRINYFTTKCPVSISREPDFEASLW